MVRYAEVNLLGVYVAPIVPLLVAAFQSADALHAARIPNEAHRATPRYKIPEFFQQPAGIRSIESQNGSCPGSASVPPVNETPA